MLALRRRATSLPQRAITQIATHVHTHKHDAPRSRHTSDRSAVPHKPPITIFSSLQLAAAIGSYNPCFVRQPSSRLKKILTSTSVYWFYPKTSQLYCKPNLFWRVSNVAEVAVPGTPISCREATYSDLFMVSPTYQLIWLILTGREHQDVGSVVC